MRKTGFIVKKLLLIIEYLTPHQINSPFLQLMGFWGFGVLGFCFKTDGQTDRQMNRQTFAIVELLLQLNSTKTSANFCQICYLNNDATLVNSQADIVLCRA